ncbi:hypothetical protein GCM10022243_23530 [Saccharothrix violaceirubra]|uniref:Membrane carboxypeptidase/penicillin-binding protein n=1 Tax=Saccharothrix violaceirubra TaxID=413306 RepID=A0A7W7T297_9PSEU|nr:penicillin-binding transpeptidase domain-containing protein [Saccharothrix violaceirubra]MBB4964707.1 membrane carboxypeptidase/penicillin-binding protein [Saccharothrix violaceirubra]
MKTRTKRLVLAGAGVLAVAAVVAGVIEIWPGTPAGKPASPGTKVPPAAVAQEFVTALATDQFAQAAGTTDAPDTAREALTLLRRNMVDARYHARLGAAPTTAADATTATIDAEVTWTLVGGALFKYPLRVELRRADERWRVHWASTVIHPELAEHQSLAYHLVSGDGALHGRDGKDPQGLPAGLRDAATKAVGSLDGKVGFQVTAVDGAGAAGKVFLDQKAEPGQVATITIDPAIQSAAQQAVDSVPQDGALVAIQPSTGEILAIAQHGSGGAQSPVALTDRYEPGSTFKIVTAAAALNAGAVTTTTPVACPGTDTIGTRTISNEDKFDLGTVPLRRAFAASCNTSFAKLAADLPADALPDAASWFGLTSDYTIPGLTTNTGKIPSSPSVPERVESGIGQGRVQVTPFGMALVAATVANGSTPTPRLVRELPAEGGRATPPPAGVVAALRTMMGDVVTGGTARELAPYGNVRGKTGTAQFGDGTHSHGWFVGYQNDLAFAVLVVDGGSSKAAVAVTSRFLGGF